MKYSPSLAIPQVQEKTHNGNPLFPVFLKLEHLRLLIVGGGSVGLEKLHAVLNNAPATAITIVAPVISTAIRELAAGHRRIRLLEKSMNRQTWTMPIL